MQAAVAPERAIAPVSLWTLALLFLRIGCTGFGGFMAMVAVTSRCYANGAACCRRRICWMAWRWPPCCPVPLR
jgi:hypothetical protein